MGRPPSHPGRHGSAQERQRRNHALNRALHRTVFDHLTRPVADPDQPGRTITFGELDLRLRGRAYRLAVLAQQQAARR